MKLQVTQDNQTTTYSDVVSISVGTDWITIVNIGGDGVAAPHSHPREFCSGLDVLEL